ncbi:MAG TPA: ParA family partition ATPase [Cellvibrio sp.]|nr:ParA family partition ATPase [Cellvibrio sp.]
MSVIISVLNQKGGAGKTTLATNIAAALQQQGGRVLLVDSDPQGSARDWKAANEKNPLAVIGLDRPSLAKDINLFVKDFDVIVIDGAPQIREMAAAAIRIADVILIPVQPSPYDIWATSELIELIKTRQTVCDGKPQSAFVVSRAIKNTHLSKEVFEALSHYSMKVFESCTTQRVIYANSAAEGLSVIDASDEKAKSEIFNIVEELKKWVA